MSDPRDDLAMTIPVLASLDLDETIAFYRDRLKFTVQRHGHYLLAKRDAMEIHFWLADDRIHPENTSCYIRGGQIVALYEEFSTAKVPGLTQFTVRPWNMKEFYIRDPHGNLLRFGAAPEEI